MASATKGGKDKMVYKAKLSEEAERYDDMVKEVKAMAELNEALTVEERNLLSVAYKNIVGARRASWRVLEQIRSKEEERGSEHVSTIVEYKKHIEQELQDICGDLLNVIEKNLIPNEKTSEGQVFYLKMSGDYYRYLAEISSVKDAADKACDKYEEARKLAEEQLPTTHPIRLGLALNFSVFYYEIRHEQSKACALAKDAFDKAISELDNLEEEQYRDATLIMQLIRDNLTLWTSDANEGGAGAGEEVVDEVDT